MLGTCPETVAAWPPWCMSISMGLDGLDGLAATILRAPRVCGQPASSTVSLTRAQVPKTPGHQAQGPPGPTPGPGDMPSVHRAPVLGGGPGSACTLHTGLGWPQKAELPLGSCGGRDWTRPSLPASRCRSCAAQASLPEETWRWAQRSRQRGWGAHGC